MKKVTNLLWFFFLSLTLSFQGNAQVTLFAVNGGANAGAPDGGAVMTIDMATGAGTVVGIPLPGWSITAADFNSAGNLFAIANQGSGSPNQLIQIDPASGALIGAPVNITVGGANLPVGDMAIQPGTDFIYITRAGFSGLANQLLTVNPATGVATLVGQPVSSGPFLQIAFAPDGTLYGLRTNQASGLITIDPNTGTQLTSTALSTSLGALALAVDPMTGLVWASECCGARPGLGNQIFTIDPANGNVTEIGSVGAGRRVHDFAFQTAAMVAVPTMGEWGLIILALLVLSFGTVFMMRRQTAIAGMGEVSMSQSSGIPFDKASYGKMLVTVMIGLVAVFAVAVFAFGYEMTNADVPGALIAGPIGAYLLHLLFGAKK